MDCQPVAEALAAPRILQGIKKIKEQKAACLFENNQKIDVLFLFALHGNFILNVARRAINKF